MKDREDYVEKYDNGKLKKKVTYSGENLKTWVEFDEKGHQKMIANFKDNKIDGVYKEVINKKLYQIQFRDGVMNLTEAQKKDPFLEDLINIIVDLDTMKIKKETISSGIISRYVTPELGCIMGCNKKGSRIKTDDLFDRSSSPNLAKWGQFSEDLTNLKDTPGNVSNANDDLPLVSPKPHRLENHFNDLMKTTEWQLLDDEQVIKEYFPDLSDRILKKEIKTRGGLVHCDNGPAITKYYKNGKAKSFKYYRYGKKIE